MDCEEKNTRGREIIDIENLCGFVRDQLSLQIHLIDFEITAREDENTYLGKKEEIKRLQGIKEIFDCTLEELEREQREEDEK